MKKNTPKTENNKEIQNTERRIRIKRVFKYLNTLHYSNFAKCSSKNTSFLFPR